MPAVFRLLITRPGVVSPVSHSCQNLSNLFGSTAGWGSMIGGDRNLLFSSPHVVVFPGIAITMTVLAFNLVGDGLRDALDPRLQR